MRSCEPVHCHPERSLYFAKRSRDGVEGSLQPPTMAETHQGILTSFSNRVLEETLESELDGLGCAGMLRLRRCFASRSLSSAQDNNLP